MRYASELIDERVEKLLVDEYENMKPLVEAHVAKVSPAQVIIHKDAAEVYKRLAKKGVIALHYTPIHQKKVVMFWEEFKSSITFGRKYAHYKINFPKTTSKLKKEFDDMEKYDIPVEKIDDVFNLINSGAQPSEIVDILKS